MKIKDMEENEKPTKYFFDQLRKKKAKTIISEIETKDGNSTNIKNEILKEIREFYKDLWSKNRKENDTKQNNLITHIKDFKLSDNEEKELNRTIEEPEIKEALDGMANNKTPGPDGLSKEFYKIFWNLIKNDLLQLYNNALSFGTTCKTWNNCSVTIIYIKGDPKSLKNWRPISQLNVDYKILTKILANRLKNILPGKISTTQKCGLPGRNIADAMRNIQEAIE